MLPELYTVYVDYVIVTLVYLHFVAVTMHERYSLLQNFIE